MYWLYDSSTYTTTGSPCFQMGITLLTGHRGQGGLLAAVEHENSGMLTAWGPPTMPQLCMTMAFNMLGEKFLNNMIIQLLSTAITHVS